MSYKLVLSEHSESATRDIGENVFLDNLPSDYEVYLFYYPGGIPNEGLESKLRSLGEFTGKNLLVNMGRLNDPSYRKIASKFGIRDLPVIIMTAVGTLACAPTGLSNAFVRIDSKKVLDSPDFAIQCVQRIFNLFVQGKVLEAMSQPRQDQREALLNRLKSVVIDALKGVGDFFADRDISISVIEGKFELKRKG